MQNVRDIVIRLFFISLASRRAPDPLSKLRCSDKISRSITYRALYLLLQIKIASKRYRDWSMTRRQQFGRITFYIYLALKVNGSSIAVLNVAEIFLFLAL